MLRYQLEAKFSAVLIHVSQIDYIRIHGKAWMETIMLRIVQIFRPISDSLADKLLGISEVIKVNFYVGIGVRGLVICDIFLQLTDRLIKVLHAPVVEYCCILCLRHQIYRLLKAVPRRMVRVLFRNIITYLRRSAAARKDLLLAISVRGA